MADKITKKGVTIYLTEDDIAEFKVASAKEGRKMAGQGELLVKKFIANSKRKHKA